MPGEPMTSSIVPLSTAGVPCRARIAAAGAGPMARAASDAAVARQLLVPEQDLAEHALRLRDRVLDGHGHGRQLPRKRRARRERQHEHECAALRHSAHSNGLAGARRRCAAGIDRRSRPALESLACSADPLMRRCRNATWKTWLGAALAVWLLLAESFAVTHPFDSAAHAERPALRRLRQRSPSSAPAPCGGRCRVRARSIAAALVVVAVVVVVLLRACLLAGMHAVLRPFPSRPEPRRLGLVPELRFR